MLRRTSILRLGRAVALFFERDIRAGSVPQAAAPACAGVGAVRCLGGLSGVVALVFVDLSQPPGPHKKPLWGLALGWSCVPVLWVLHAGPAEDDEGDASERVICVRDSAMREREREDRTRP